MRRTVLLIGIGLMSAEAAAQQATTTAGTSRAYGTRVGVRNESPDYPGVSLDPRAIKRLPTRVETRLNSRIERRTDPTDALWAYRVLRNDGSRAGAPDLAAPSRGAGAVSATAPD